MAKKTTTAERVFFTKQDTTLKLPNLITHQLQSWADFVREGLGEIFAEVNPIKDYTETKLELRFKDYRFEDPKMTEAYARENNVSYDAPLKATVELTNKVTGEIKEQEIYLGDYPWMTANGTFIINGSERVVVNQLIRSAGVFFTSDTAGGRTVYGAKLIPGRGAWLEFETAASGAMYVKIDRRRKIPVTTLLRALGYATNTAIKDLFKDVDTGELNYVDATLDKDPSKGANEAMIEVYRRLRPGDLATVDNARGMIERMFFDFKRFDLSRVGRYKVNQRLHVDVPNTTENRVMRLEDLTAIIGEVIRLNNTQEAPDDIDALHNRRVKLVGELVARQFRIGMLRMERNAKDRMSMSDLETVTPAQLINARPVVAAVREFFASSQLSQFMDHTNPLSELAHKRRLSSMGPGGLSRERAGFEVRDVHPTHYGRLCTVETPEGANIGLVLNLASYARINEYGFMEAPYRKVTNGKVSNDVVYFDAAQEALEIIAESGNILDDDNTFKEGRVSARVNLKPGEVDVAEVTYIDAVRKQTIGTTAALIPFVEKNRIDRSLTGSNMQKQATPCVLPEAPLVATGIEQMAASDTGRVILAKEAGEVIECDAKHIVVKNKNGKKDEYPLRTFERTNDFSAFYHRPAVTVGDKLKRGGLLADTSSTDNGQIAVGQNALVAFMSWSGANYEDAIIISERLVKDSKFATIHMDELDVAVRDTKLGPEVTTPDIPNVSELKLRNLDENGVIRIGAEVRPGDILVGKVTPKGETQLTPEERLLRSIFGEKAKDVKDTSLRLEAGKRGRVIGVKIFSRENGDQLESGVIKRIHITVAQVRNVSVGDKLAGRHGNKGVISRILPEEDMPYTEDGRPVDVLLTPLGVPSRMNLGQILELHLGMAANTLGYQAIVPPFAGASEDDVKAELKDAGLPEDGKLQLRDGRTGEEFAKKTAVGYMYILKLHHMVEDKIHMRSIGPYSLITQQPLGGKAQIGGQRFGEMEVWALLGYGAAYTLREMLTIKSDDIVGRSAAFDAIVRGESISHPHTPAAFNVLVNQLRGLSLDVNLVRSNEEDN